MPWYPAAIKRPVTRFNPGGTKAVRRTKGRGTCNHVAVSEAASLFNYFNTPGSPCSHFYVRRSGVVEQYVDTDYRAPANLEGNTTLLSIETQGGVNNVETEPWTELQIQALIELHIWLQGIDGFPSKLMEDSRPSTKGIGWHELGVEPHVVSGGEKWSESYGKVCPGNKKIEQIRTRILPGMKKEGLSMADAASLEAQIKALDAKLTGFAEAESNRYGVGTARYNVETGRWEAEDNRWMGEVARDQAEMSKLNEILSHLPVTLNYAEIAARIAENLQINLPEVSKQMVEEAVAGALERVSFTVNPPTT